MAMSGGSGNPCVFSAVADPSYSIHVQIYDDEACMVRIKELESLSEHLPGLGDDAFWHDISGTVFVQKGSRAFSFAAPLPANFTSTNVQRAAMVTLAKAALGRF